MADTFLITKPGLLAFGERLPSEPSITTFFQDETVVDISCGGGHSAVVCESGRVYIFGRTREDELDGDNKFAGPTLVESLATVRVIQAGCGYRSTVFLSDKGEVWSCGWNNHGQLGLGHTDYVLTPALVTGLPPIKKLAVGYSATMLLTDKDEVWVCGSNVQGKLGLGHTDLQTTFTKVPNLLEPIIDISCGGHHTVLITASRILLVSGWNKRGQLGLREVEGRSNFQPVSLPSTVAAVACAWEHTVALCVDGTTWAWGYTGCGQLGTGKPYDDGFTPNKMLGLEDQTISQVFAGCHHTAVLTREGDVFMCGRGTSGQLGPAMENISTPTLITKSPGLIVQQVAFASNYSLLFVVPK